MLPPGNATTGGIRAAPMSHLSRVLLPAGTGAGFEVLRLGGFFCPASPVNPVPVEAGITPGRGSVRRFYSANSSISSSSPCHWWYHTSPL